MTTTIGSSNQYVGNVRPTSIEKDSYEQDLFANRTTDIPSNMQIRIEYNADGTELYVGYGAKGLASNATGWLIHKLSYNATPAVTLRQSYYGNWDARATYTYE